VKKTISDAGIFGFEVTARYIHQEDSLVRIEFAADDYATRDVRDSKPLDRDKGVGQKGWD